MARWLAATTLSVGLLASSISAAHACSVVATLFWPEEKDRQAFDRPDGAGGEWEPIPQPIIEIAKFERGNPSDSPGDCSNIGWLVLDISLPLDSRYRIEDLGVYFRLKRGTAPIGLLGDAPRNGDIKGRKMRVPLYWEDDDRNKQSPLDLDIEAFLVAPDLSIGASTVFTVKEKPSIGHAK